MSGVVSNSCLAGRGLRSAAAIGLGVLLAGCASTHAVRGQFSYDIRPATQRDQLVWPLPPDPPRYRFAGELIGEPNFERKDESEVTLTSALMWIAGLFEEKEPVMLRRPQHGTVDDKGRVYIVDASYNAVLVFDPHPPAEDKSGKSGGQLLVWDGRDGSTSFGAPMAVARVWDGDLAVSDIKRGAVVRVNSKGTFVGTIGEGQLQRPTGLAFDAKRGLLYVADTVAHDIKVYESNGMLVDTFGSAGEKDGQLNAPTFLAFENDHLYVTDTLNSRVQVFDTTGQRVQGFGERGLNIGNMARPKGVAVSDSITYVVESYFGYLLAYNDKNELLLGINGAGTREDRFLLPSGVWTDKQRRVYVADMFNGRVVVFQLLDTKD